MARTYFRGVVSLFLVLCVRHAARDCDVLCLSLVLYVCVCVCVCVRACVRVRMHFYLNALYLCEHRNFHA